MYIVAMRLYFWQLLWVHKLFFITWEWSWCWGRLNWRNDYHSTCYISIDGWDQISWTSWPHGVTHYLVREQVTEKFLIICCSSVATTNITCEATIQAQVHWQLFGNERGRFYSDIHLLYYYVVETLILVMNLIWWFDQLWVYCWIISWHHFNLPVYISEIFG